MSQARAAQQENLKKQRSDQKIIENNYDTSNNKANSGWYWHNSFNKEYFDLNKELAGETQGEEKEEELIESGNKFSIMESAVLGWDIEGKAKLCGI